MRWLSICPAAGLPSQTTAAPVLGCTVLWSACLLCGWWRQWPETCHLPQSLLRLPCRSWVGASLMSLYSSRPYQYEQLHGRSSEVLAISASTAMQDLYPMSSFRATALRPHRIRTRPLSSSTYCHSCGSCHGTTSIKRSLGNSHLLHCAQPLACTMWILVSVGLYHTALVPPFLVLPCGCGSACCALSSPLNLGACCQLFCYPCMSGLHSHHRCGCM